MCPQPDFSAAESLPTTAIPGQSSQIIVMPSPEQMAALERARAVGGSASHKFDRAVRHIAALESEIQSYLDRRPYRWEVVDERGNSLVQLWRMVVEEPASPRLSLMIGDCLHNLRSSLDHIVWELSRRHAGEILERTEFPIFRDHGIYHARTKAGKPDPRSGLHKVRGLAADAQVTVEGFQPYHRGLEADGHPLWLLHQLSNTDKHRALVLAVTVVDRPEFGVAAAENLEIESVMATVGVVHDGDVAARVRLRRIDPTREAGGRLDVQVSPLVAFGMGEPGEGWPVHRTMTDIRQTVAEAIVALSRFL